MLVLLNLQNQSFHIPFTVAAGPDLTPCCGECTPANARYLASTHGLLNQSPSLLCNLIVHAQSLSCVPFVTRPFFFATLCNPMNCSPPGSSVQGIFQARILAWVAISYSRGSSSSKDRTRVSCVSCIGKRILYHFTTWAAPYNLVMKALKKGIMFHLASSSSIWPRRAEKLHNCRWITSSVQGWIITTH